MPDNVKGFQFIQLLQLVTTLTTNTDNELTFASRGQWRHTTGEPGRLFVCFAFWSQSAICLAIAVWVFEDIWWHTAMPHAKNEQSTDDTSMVLKQCIFRPHTTVIFNKSCGSVHQPQKTWALDFAFC